MFSRLRSYLAQQLNQQTNKSMKLKLLTSVFGAATLLAATSAFALTAAQESAINAKINAATTANLASEAAAALTANCDCGASDSITGPCVAFVVNAAKAKLGSNASIAAVRNLVNALVAACPTKAPGIVSAAAGAFPTMKANIAAAAQGALNTAAQGGQITQAQATTLSSAVNTATGVSTPAGPTGGRAGSLFQANQAVASTAARAEFQRSNQNNYRAP